MDYPSNKRMKKRKELDALVSSGKKKPLKTCGMPDRLFQSKGPASGARGDHELLRSQDSESEEEVASFNHSRLIDKPLRTALMDADVEKSCIARRRQDRGCLCCADYPPTASPYNHPQKRSLCRCSKMFTGLLLAACLLSLGVLAWMHLSMKRDAWVLESRFKRISMGYAKITQQITRLKHDVEEDQSRLALLESEEFSQLNSTVEGLAKDLAEAQRSLSVLPVGISAKMAEFGNRIATLAKSNGDLEEQHVNHEKTLEALRNRVIQLEEKTRTMAKKVRSHENLGPIKSKI